MPVSIAVENSIKLREKFSARAEFAIRGDGTVAGNTVTYHKQAGAWVPFTTA